MKTHKYSENRNSYGTVSIVYNGINADVAMICVQKSRVQLWSKKWGTNINLEGE